MALGKLRNRILSREKRGVASHRYVHRRIWIGILASILVASIPIASLLRFDFWSGRHMLLGEEVDLVTAAKAFAFPFLAVNVVILFATRFFGRYLCGFGCPIGAFARMGEALRFPQKGLARAKRMVLLGVGSITIASIVFVFWIDPRVFLEGSPFAMGVSFGILAAMSVVVYVGARSLGLRFCRDWCPSGVYFALLGHETQSGVQFANPDSCTECKLCELVCPVDLEPRHLDGVNPSSGRGIYPEGLSNHAMCLRCGDCIRVCEGTAGGDEAPALTMGSIHRTRNEASEPVAACEACPQEVSKR